jgi:hypothetical protein
LAALAIFGIIASPAFAQPPSPKVTIGGFLDQTTSWSSNMSIYDVDATDEDEEWYSRSRGQFQITGEVGKVKGVMKFEQDNTWGSSGCANGIASAGTCGFARRDGPINTELAGNVEMLMIYTEFPLTGPGGLLPFVPFPGTMRAGIQPFIDETYKLSAIATGQFGGVHFDLEPMPGFKVSATYAASHEAQTGADDGFLNGDDYGLFFGLEMTPMQGLKIKAPVVHYYSADGATGHYGYRSRGGVSDTTAFFPRGAHESRWTVGVDAVWQAGPWSLAPTVLYQAGSREIVPGGAGGATCAGACREQDISAWFIDIRGGWRSGPLEVEGLFLYTTGNEAEDNIGDVTTATRRLSDVNYYWAFNTYSGFAAGWGAITALMHDYLVNLNYGAGGLNPSTSIGYDKYGRFQFGVRAFYSLTPTFKLRGVATPIWTAEDVDNRGTTAGATGLTPSATRRGRDDFIGTEFDFGFDWNFAPNITLSTIYGPLYAGDALGNNNFQNGRNRSGSADDVDLVSAVVRYSF